MVSLHENGYKSLINGYTRVAGDSKSCIDHIFLKNKNLNYKTLVPIILHSKISDHYPIIFKYPISNHIQHQKILYIDKTYINYNKFIEQFKKYNFADIYNSDDIEFCTKQLIQWIEVATKQSTYKKTIKLCNKKKPWITDELIETMQKRDKLYHKYRRNKNPRTHEQYKASRNNITKMIKETKKEYFKNIIKSNIKNNKKLWQTINIYNNKNQKQEKMYPTEIINQNQDIVQDPKKIADIFNEHYSTIGSRMAREICEQSTAPDNFVTDNYLVNSMVLFPVTKNEIITIIKTLKNDTTPGKDCITVKLLKESAAVIAEPIMHLINLIFIQGYCPKHFKLAVVKPIYKKGLKDQVINYRPISLISNLAKVFEKTLKTRLVTI